MSQINGHVGTDIATSSQNESQTEAKLRGVPPLEGTPTLLADDRQLQGNWLD